MGNFTNSSSLIQEIEGKQKRIVQSATTPTTPQSGDYWFDTTNLVLKHYNGTARELIGANVRVITQEDYDDLTPAEQQNGTLYLITGDSEELTIKWSNITNKPSFATVATSGSYNDLTNKPTIPSSLGDLSGNSDNITEGITHKFVTTAEKDKISTAVQPGDLATVATSGDYNDLINLPSIPVDADDVNALPDTTKYGASLSMTMNSSTYVVTAQLKDQDGNNLGAPQTIDLPLESVVVSGSYDSATKKVILTLKDGSTVDFSIADLVSGLQSEITSTNKLDAELVDDTNSAHKFVSATEKSTWNGKQDALTTAQLNAVNSGITSAKVSTYDGYATSKQDKLTIQTAYSQKGSATKVPQITTNTLGQVTGITEINIEAGADIYYASVYGEAGGHKLGTDTTYEEVKTAYGAGKILSLKYYSTSSMRIYDFDGAYEDTASPQGYMIFYFYSKHDNIYYKIGYSTSGWERLSGNVSSSEVLAKNNTTAFTPTGDYNPATKKYVDDGLDTKQDKATNGSTAPSVTPSYIGQFYVDTTNHQLYVATGTSSSSDWYEVGAGFGDVLYSDFAWQSKTGASITLDLASTITPSANFTVNAPATIKDGQTYILRVNNGSTVYTMTLGTHITNPYGTSIELTKSGVDQFVFLAIGGDLELQPEVQGGSSADAMTIHPESPIKPKYNWYGTKDQYEALSQYYYEEENDTVFHTIDAELTSQNRALTSSTKSLAKGIQSTYQGPTIIEPSLTPEEQADGIMNAALDAVDDKEIMSDVQIEQERSEDQIEKMNLILDTALDFNSVKR